MRLALVTLLLVPAIAWGQAKDDDDRKVSNDQPGRPLQMSPASTEVKEAFDDFERFQRRGAWERALQALYTIPEDQTVRFVDGENGFIIPVARKRRTVLSALPPEGQAAYRLFYDAEAKKLLDEAEGATELKNLERVYSAYFVSSVGDNAADRLGDLYFELGRFDRAADCWLAIVRERPDTDLSPAVITVKAALALIRAGRRSELEQLRSETGDRYNDEKVNIGGRSGSPAELIQRLVAESNATTDTAKPKAPAAESGLNVAGEVDALWQMRFAESVEAGMTPPELSQWESNPLSVVVPAVAIEGTNLFTNYLGYIFALDLKNGKMLWRSAAFHHLEVPAMQQQARALDPSRFAIVASGEYLWHLARDLKDPNFFSPFRLTCRRAETGEVVWQSTDLADYAQIDLVGPPLLAGGRLFVAGKSQMDQQQQRPPQQFVLAIQPHDGKLLWKTEIGSMRQAPQFYFWYGMRDSAALPRLLHRAGAVYVDTHVGVLARLDADSGSLDWGYGYQTEAAQGEGRFFFFAGEMMNQEASTSSSEPLPAGEALLIKGSKSDRLYAIEPNRMKVLWDRPISKSARLLGSSDRVAFLGGPELSALDMHNRKLLWATRVPGGSAEARVLVRPDGIWQLTARGVFEIDPNSGDVRRIFRGKDLGGVGGDLFLTEQLLLSVSNRTISAYPRRRAEARVGVRENPATIKKRASND
jgi:outer membrane protein assembly factor BamB